MSRRRKAAAPAVQWRITINREGERLAVRCHLHHLMSSGMPVAELFAQVQPELELAVRTAAARDPGRAPMASPVGVQLEFNVADPEIWLIVHDPASCVIDIASQLSRLQQMLEKVAAAERANITKWFSRGR